MPAGVPVDRLPVADDVADAARIDSEAAIDCDSAAAKPMRAARMTDLEKYIAIAVRFFQRLPNELGYANSLVKRVDVGDSRSEKLSWTSQVYYDK